MTPLVSVIIPTYNRSRTLPRAIDSVLSQTFTDFELIVIDDGSTDDTREILSPYAGLTQFRVIYQMHRGSAAACNRGVRVSKGSYLAFQGSDDEWTQDKLEIAVKTIDSSGSQAGVFYSDMLKILPDGTSWPHQSPEVKRGTFIDENTLDFAVVGIGSNSAVIKRTCFEDEGLFDERLPRFLDLELFIRLLDRFDFLYSTQPLVRWYDGNGISRDAGAGVNARLYLLEKYRRRLEEDERHLAGQYLQVALALHLNGRVPEAYDFVLQALRLCPSHPLIRETAFRFFPRLEEEMPIGLCG